MGFIQARGATFSVTYKVIQTLPISLDNAEIAIVVEVPGDG